MGGKDTVSPTSHIINLRAALEQLYDPRRAPKFQAEDAVPRREYGRTPGDGAGICRPAIDSDGTLYVGSGDKKIYAIKTDFKGPAKNPWPIRGQNAQRTGRASKNLLRKYGGKHDYELKTEGKYKKPLRQELKRLENCAQRGDSSLAM